MALVTIVVPTYNRRHYLLQTLESIKKQTFLDYKVIVADDAGADDLSDIVYFQDPRFELLRRETNFGMGKNIWSALSAASTKYVAKIDDDDLWEPDFLSTMITALEKNKEVVVAFCDILHVDSDNHQLEDLTTSFSVRYGRANLAEGFHQPFIYEGVLKSTIPAAMGAVFRREMIDWDNFPVEVGGYYDEWLAYLAVRNGAPVWYSPQFLTRYRVHNASETAAGGFSEAIRLRQRCQAEFISRAKLADPAVRMCHAELVKKNRRALVGVVNSSILAEQRSVGWERLRSARSFHSSALIASLQLALLIPTQFSKIALKVKRLITAD